MVTVQDKKEIFDAPIIFATIGVNEGYNHDNEDKIDFCETVQNICASYHNITGAYVSFVVSKTTTVYNKDCGCPKGGEVTYTLLAEPNPFFVYNKEKFEEYSKHVKKVLVIIANTYRQTTIRITETKSRLTTECKLLYDGKDDENA